jgi:PAS domain S-box-containing protein
MGVVVRTEERSGRLLRAVEGWAGALTAVLGAIILLGWMFDVPALKSVLPGTTAMKANTAFCFILSGAAFWVASGEPGLGKAKLVGIACATLVLFTCGLTLVEYLTGWTLGLDEALVKDAAASAASYPGRMAPNTAVAFLLLNAALLLLVAPPSRGRLTGASLLGVLTALLGLFAVTGYVGNVGIGYGWSDLTTMALLTGMVFIVLGTAAFGMAWNRAGLRLAIGGRRVAEFAVGLAVFVAMGVASYKSARRFAETADWVRHTVEVLAKLQEVHSDVAKSQIAVRGFVITGHEEFLAHYQEGLTRLEEDERALRRLTTGDPIQEARLATLEDLIRRRQAFSAQTVDVYRRQGREAAATLISTGQGQELLNGIASLVEAMERTEWDLLAQREVTNRAITARTFLILPVGTFIGISVLVAVLFALNSEATERLQAEAASRDAAAVVESTGDAVITKTLGGIITSWNPGAQRIFGYTAQEAIGHPVLMVIPPERVSEEEEILGRIARCERVEHFETVRVGKDGRPLDVSVTVSPIKDTSGRVVGASKILHDITERKAAAEALQRLGTRLTTTLENMNAAFFTLDREWRFTYLNKESERLLRRARVELLGQRIWDEFKEAIGGPFYRQYHLAIAEDRPVAIEEFYAPLGMWLEVSAYPSSDGLAVYFRDVTERKQAAERLRESEERFSAAFRSSPAAIAIGRVEDRVSLDVNDSFLRLFECTRDEVIGHTLVGLGLFEEESTAPFRQQLADTGSLDNAEVAARTRHGRPLTISFSARVIHLGGEACSVATLVDITARRQAEAQRDELGRQRQLALGAARLGWWHYDPATRISSWDERYKEIFGVSESQRPNEEILARLHPDDLPHVWAAVEAALDPDQPRSYSAEYRVNHPDGSVHWVEAHGVASFEGEGEERRATSLVGTVQDITERKLAEGRLRQLHLELEQRVIERTEQLEAANREMEAFSYSVSHDLRAPLRTVDGFSQALLEDFGPQLPEEGQRQVRTIREGAQRMGTLIDDLLAFSRLGRQSLAKPAVVDMDGLVRESLEELLPERQGRHLEIRAAPLPPGLGDRALLKQVWANLLSNAIKYTRKRDRAVVEIGSESANGETVYFVRDNGTGFDMRYAHKLFGVFQRLHRAEDFEGTGVGLAIVQRVVQRHGGRVWAESTVDRGATFHFSLPKGAAA